jgi:hypothetical protein
MLKENKMKIPYFAQIVSYVKDIMNWEEIAEERRFQQTVRCVEALALAEESNQKSRRVCNWSDAVAEGKFTGSLAEYLADPRNH